MKKDLLTENEVIDAVINYYHIENKGRFHQKQLHIWHRNTGLGD